MCSSQSIYCFQFQDDLLSDYKISVEQAYDMSLIGHGDRYFFFSLKTVALKLDPESATDDPFRYLNFDHF